MRGFKDHTDRIKAAQGQQTSHDLTKALYKHAYANPDAPLSAMKQRDHRVDPTSTSADRTKQFVDRNRAALRQLVQKTRMMNADTGASGITEAYDVRNNAESNRLQDLKRSLIRERDMLQHRNLQDICNYKIDMLNKVQQALEFPRIREHIHGRRLLDAVATINRDMLNNISAEDADRIKMKAEDAIAVENRR